MLDPALIDLFRSEVETHSDALNAALLDLERHPGDTSRVDEMMRAAHSIKGAARIVGIDPAVKVAHTLEDGFVALLRQSTIPECSPMSEGPSLSAANTTSVGVRSYTFGATHASCPI